MKIMLRVRNTLFLAVMVTAFWVSGSVPLVAVADTSTPEASTQTYLDALVAGDVVTLESLLDGNLLKKYQRLLTKNTTYPDYLRERYTGVVIVLESVTQAGANYHVKVKFDYPSSGVGVVTFVLRSINGQWKIVEEVL